MRVLLFCLGLAACSGSGHVVVPPSASKTVAVSEAPVTREEVLRLAKEDDPASRAKLARVVRTHPDVAVRHAAAIGYFVDHGFRTPKKLGNKLDVTDEERAWARELLDQVPPNDPLWALGDSLWTVLSIAGAAPDGAYARAFVDTHSSPAAVAGFLWRWRCVADPETVLELTKTLKNKRFKRTIGQVFAEAWDPDRPLGRGKPMADFALRSISDEASPRTYTLASFAGRYLVLDIWATWCGACVDEMPKLEPVYAKYAQHPGVTFASASIDDSVEIVRSFLREKDVRPSGIQTMPLRLDGPLSGHLGLFLVDPQGKIVASSPELDPQQLETLLAERLR